MPIRTLERIKQVITDVETNANEAIASAPIGFVADSLDTVLRRRRHSMNVILLGGFNTDYQDKNEATKVGKDALASLLGTTALKDADVLFIEAFNFQDEEGKPTERERESVSTTAKLLKEVSQERMEGVIATSSIDVIGKKLEPVVFEVYLPRAEKNIQAGHSKDRVITYLGVLPASRIGQGFGLNPTDMLDGGIAERSSKDASWRQVSIGGRLGLLR